MSKCATCEHRKPMIGQTGSICELARLLPHPLSAETTAIYTPCADAETSLHFYEQAKTRIASAAVCKAGKIYTGRRHSDAIHACIKDGGEAPVTSAEQGFITDAGVFVDRAEAARIAYAAGQIKEPKDRLFSEDIA